MQILEQILDDQTLKVHFLVLLLSVSAFFFIAHIKELAVGKQKNAKTHMGWLFQWKYCAVPGKLDVSDAMI